MGVIKTGTMLDMQADIFFSNYFSNQGLEAVRSTSNLPFLLSYWLSKE